MCGCPEICRDPGLGPANPRAWLLCPVGPGPGQKSAERAGPGQIFTGLSHMAIQRDRRDWDKNSGTVPSRPLPNPDFNDEKKVKNYRKGL